MRETLIDLKKHAFVVNNKEVQDFCKEREFYSPLRNFPQEKIFSSVLSMFLT